MDPRRPPRPRTRDGFEIALICALTLEADAVISLFDHHWDEEDPNFYGKARGDPNAYSIGVIGHHNVVLAHLPGMGKVAAGSIAAFCRMSFPNIRLALVVGVCGGAPFYGQRQIFLGDVVISDGVVQYDFGRRFPDRFQIKDTLSDSLGRPNLEIRSLLSKLKTARQVEKLENAIQACLDPDVHHSIKYSGRSADQLFPADYRHKHQDPSICTQCASYRKRTDPVCDTAASLGCEELGCETNKHLSRHLRHEDEEQLPRPAIHFGRVASGDTVIKSGEDRDDLTREQHAIAFEMESAGVWDVFPCVVIKGVCDYADNHKNKDWQEYAATSAAACSKAFLGYWASTVQ
jgi:nucleoside phosphorylase